jgi:hypothetical protein
MIMWGHSHLAVKHPVKQWGQSGQPVGVGLKVRRYNSVLSFLLPHGRLLLCVLRAKSAICAMSHIEKFIPNICHLSIFLAFLRAIIEPVNFYTGPPISICAGPPIIGMLI